MKTFTRYIKLAFLFIVTNALFVTPSIAQHNVFYGMTSTGGTNDIGAIIRFDPSTGAESMAWSFGSDTDGSTPLADLVYDATTGLFYGTTSVGGSGTLGTFFSFDPVTNRDSVLLNCGIGQGSQRPYGNLVKDPVNGLYYGMTYDGGNNSIGTVTSFDPTTGSSQVVWSLAGFPNDGSNPQGSLVYDSANGLFYTMTSDGGTIGNGTLLSFDPVTNTDSVLWNFGPQNAGETPVGNLVYDPVNGSFYGMTNVGGTNGHGTIFRFDPGADTVIALWNFETETDGTNPWGSFTYDAGRGLFYATTSFGGTTNYGTIISFNPTTNTEAVLWNFGATNDGRSPYGNLTYNPADGLYYGMTEGGGTIYSGTIFSFNPATNSDSVLYNFKNRPDGASPRGSLVMYSSNTNTGIETVTSPPTINIFPNPTTGSFNITGLSAGQTIKVYNYLGQKIAGGAVENSTQQIDVSSQPNGVYLIQVLNKDGVVVSEQRVVKIN